MAMSRISTPTSADPLIGALIIANYRSHNPLTHPRSKSADVQYRIGKRIGKGEFSDVYEVTATPTTFSANQELDIVDSLAHDEWSIDQLRTVYSAMRAGQDDEVTASELHRTKKEIRIMRKTMTGTVERKKEEHEQRRPPSSARFVIKVNRKKGATNSTSINNLVAEAKIFSDVATKQIETAANDSTHLNRIHIPFIIAHSLRCQPTGDDRKQIGKPIEFIMMSLGGIDYSNLRKVWLQKGGRGKSPNAMLGEPLIAMHFGVTALDALEPFHRFGLTHRDIKVPLCSQRTSQRTYICEHCREAFHSQ